MVFGVCMPKTFQKKIEDFDCSNCGLHIKGNGYTDHCPQCLYGKHVDINPGDRANKCKGTMVPISTDYHSNSFTIHYECSECGAKKSFKASADDNKELLFGLLNKGNSAAKRKAYR